MQWTVLTCAAVGPCHCARSAATTGVAVRATCANMSASEAWNRSRKHTRSAIGFLYFGKVLACTICTESLPIPYHTDCRRRDNGGHARRTYLRKHLMAVICVGGGAEDEGGGLFAQHLFSRANSSRCHQRPSTTGYLCMLEGRSVSMSAHPSRPARAAPQRDASKKTKKKSSRQRLCRKLNFK